MCELQGDGAVDMRDFPLDITCWGWSLIAAQQNSEIPVAMSQIWVDTIKAKIGLIMQIHWRRTLYKYVKKFLQNFTAN